MHLDLDICGTEWQGIYDKKRDTVYTLRIVDLEL